MNPQNNDNGSGVEPDNPALTSFPTQNNPFSSATSTTPSGSDIASNPDQNTNSYPNQLEYKNSQEGFTPTQNTPGPLTVEDNQPLPVSTFTQNQTQNTNPYNRPEHPSPAIGNSSNPILFASGGMSVPGFSNHRESRLKNRRTLAIAGIFLGLLLIGGTAFVFGYYIPNKPENVWDTALNRTGSVTQDLFTEATTKDRLDALKKSEIQASINVEYAEEKFGGTLDAKYDPKKGNYRITFSSQEGGETEQKLSLDVISDIADGKTLPDSYFRFSGISTLGLSNYLPGIEQYDSKWIEVSSDYLQSQLGEEEQQEELSDEDIVALSKVFLDTTDEYIFTTDSEKAVLERREIIGPEVVNDLKTYHYKVGLNKDNLKEYCTTLSTRIIEHPAYKKIPGGTAEDAGQAKKDAEKECSDSINEIKDDYTFDVWIDRKYKLIHKTRFTEKGKDIYTEYGQVYKGGDDLRLFITYHDGVETIDGTFNLDLNVKSSVAKGSLEVSGGEDDEKFNVSMKIDAKPFGEEVDAAKPDESIPIEEVLEKLGLNEYFGTASQDSSSIGGAGASDSERKSDLSAIHAQLEAYFATNGYYPTLSEINDPNWMGTNLPGLDPETLKDPIGSENSLADTASYDKYGYVVQRCLDTGRQCQQYELSALLDNGETFSKSSLN